MRIALFEPDIPQNAAAIVRLGACMGVPVDIVEPCGFQFSEAGFRRVALDYADRAAIKRHDSFERFRTQLSGRMVLLTTKASLPYTEFRFEPHDCLLLGRESAGVPDFVHMTANARIRIPLQEGLRSLNVAQAAAMVLGEALRQTDGFGAAKSVSGERER